MFNNGSLPPPPVWSEDEMKSPEIEPNNPFFQNQNSDDLQQQPKQNVHSTPGGPSMDPSNPFYAEQQEAVHKYKQQKALQEQQEQYSQQYDPQQQQQQQQQQYNAYQQQQQYAAQQQAYAAQQAMQQQAMQQQYYNMQSMHNMMSQQQSMHNIMGQQQSMHNLNINANAMNIMAQTGSFRQQMSPHRSPTNPYFNQQKQGYYNQQQSNQLSPKTQALNAFTQSLDNNNPNPNPNPLLTDEKQEEKKSETQLKEEKRSRNRVRAVDELISTEKTYVSKLTMLNDLYVTPMRTNVKLLKKPAHHGQIFPVVLQTIIALNNKLLITMEKDKNEIGKSIYDFIPYLKMYQNYMNNHESASRLIKEYRKDKNCEFTKYLISKEAEQSGFTLESYLILPIQRIPRYELMLKEIIKLTLDEHKDKENLCKCYDQVAAVNKQINVRLKDYETRQKVRDIEVRIINLEINKEKNVKKSSMNLFKRRNSNEQNNLKENVERTRLVQPSRIFIKQGHLIKVSRKKDIKYLFVLFNDLLIYCAENAVNDKLILHQKIDITDEFFRIESAVILDDDIDYDNINDNKKDNSKDKPRENTFEIHSIEKSFLCYAESAKEREDWIDAIEKCLDNIKKSGIEQKKNKNNNLDIKGGNKSGVSGDFGRFNSAPVSGTGNSRFDKMMMVATAPSAIEAAEDEGRILETAPMWIPNDWSDECMMPNCNNKFSTLLLKKRNHCRYCGKLVCSDCCTNTLPHYEPKKRNAKIHVKVCDVCHDKYKVKPLMNVEQLHNISKSMDKIQDKDKNQKKNNINKHINQSSVQIEEEESKSMMSNSSDEWSGLYDNMQLNNSNSNNINSGNAFIKIPQSHTPVSAPQPAIMNGDNELKGMYSNNNGIHSASYSSNNMQNMNYVNNYNHNPLLQSSPRKSPRRMNNNSNSSHGLQNMSGAFPNISPIHNMSNSYSNAFDAIDAMDNPLPPDEKNNIFNPKKKSVADVKYSQDLGTVSAIIAANDNLINSMDMSNLGGNYQQNNKRVSLQEESKHKKIGNAVVLDENIEARDDSDSDEFAANFKGIVIPDSHKNEELYGFMASPKIQPAKNNLLDAKDVINLDKTNDNVKQLTMFGFTWPQIEDAWKMMKKNDKHKNVVPDHGPLFVETMLDYLNKVQKEKSKSKILGAYKNPDNRNGGMFAGIDNDNQNFNFQF